MTILIGALMLCAATALIMYVFITYLTDSTHPHYQGMPEAHKWAIFWGVIAGVIAIRFIASGAPEGC